MPLETRDHDPYWTARNSLTSQELDDIRNQATRIVNDRIAAATRALGPAAEAARKAAQESGEAAARFKADVQAEIDRRISNVVGQGPEGPRSSNPVAYWAEARVGRGGYGRLDPAPDARGQIDNLLPRDKRGRIDPKCNQFVWDALQAGGVPAGRLDGGRIPVAKEWGDPSSKIAGYSPVVGQPRPGDVVSNGHHVGIYSPLPDGRPGTVSASSPFTHDGGWDGGVTHNDWGFRGDEGPMTFWRPTSAPKR